VLAKIGFVSLGCPKALVDAERILTRLRAEGYATARDYGGADLVIVNTCAVHEHLPKPHDPFTDLVPPQGVKLTPQHYAYLKSAARASCRRRPRSANASCRRRSEGR
jgi:hypothetical protein